jgi:AAA family ATP:ADP antiporter
LDDYQFSALAAEVYPDQDRLAAFFGFWYSTFNIVALIIQLLLTQRVVQSLGVGGTLLFLPVGLGVGAVVMLFMPGLNAATLSRSVDGSLKQSLGRASVEMLFLPLTEETKKKVKTYIDVFVDSLAGGVSGLLLIALTQVLSLSATEVSYVILVLISIWLTVVVFIREEYIDAFRAQLSHLKPKKRRNPLRRQHRQIMASFLQVLEEGEMSTHEKQLLYVLERTDDLDSPSFREPIRRLLGHPSANVRARALRSLYLQPGSELIGEVTPLLNDESDQVRAAAFDYLFSRTGDIDEKQLEHYLADPDPDIGGTALVSLASEAANNAYARQKWQVEKRLRARMRALRETAGEQRDKWMLYLLRASGRSNTAVGRQFIDRCLVSHHKQVVRYAILAAGESQHEDLIVPLLNLLPEPVYRPLAINALVQYGAGLLAVLPPLMVRKKLSVVEVRQLPLVLERINRRQSVNILIDCIRRYYPHDLHLRTAAIRGLNHLQSESPRRKMPAKPIYRILLAECQSFDEHQQQYHIQKLLLNTPQDERQLDAREDYLDLIERRMNASFDRMMRLLGLRYPPADIIPVHLALKSNKTAMQISAIEFLDNLLELSLKRLVIPLLDRHYRNKLTDAVEMMNPEESGDSLLHDETQAIKKTLGGHDKPLRIAALRLLATRQGPEHRALLAHYAASERESKRVRQVAREGLHEREKLSLPPL